MALLFPNKLMLQNASYIWKKKRNKTKQNDYEKKKKVSPGGSRTWDLWRVRATRYPLPHATIVNTICQINNMIGSRQFTISRLKMEL